ncbi:hypothetical protein [Celerinatantimonas sp. YJH-8]|uniref:hypothetical protein n=1 Tax=Celerinatantimonas sp. YJH-8 TaxID=3228714 RepID=UPI0038C309D8
MPKAVYTDGGVEQEGFDMRLGRRGWNNVLIFVALAMILLFKLTGERLNRSPSSDEKAAQQVIENASEATLLPPNVVVLELDLPGRVIQRVGTAWQSTPPAGRPVVTVDAWLHIVLPIWKKALGGTVQGDVIRVFVARSSEPLELTLFHVNDQYFISNWQGQLLKLDQSSYNALFSLNP